MQIGRFSIEQLTEGQFEFFTDGKINRTPVTETRQKKSAQSGARQLVGINPLYVSDGEYHILLDTGLGWGLDAGSNYPDVSNICTNLDIFDVKPADITHVILSHLHYDHAAGSSFTDKDAFTQPTFPNASYILQQAEWDFAVEQMQSNHPFSAFYRLDDLYRLYSSSHFTLVKEARKEIIPGIVVFRTGGHTPGHQIVRMFDEEETAYFLGDLVSISGQLNHSTIPAKHYNQLQTKKMSTRLLRKAYEKEAIIYLYHSLSSKPCRLSKDENKNFVLTEIDEN